MYFRRLFQRRRFQFSLGRLFLAVAILCVLLGVQMHRANRQREAVAAIEAIGGQVSTIEQSIAAAFEKAKPATVRIAWGKNDQRCSSGVILTDDGYVVSSGRLQLAPGEPVAFFLADGRRLTGTTLGSSWEWGIGLMKIADVGPWPHAEIGKSADMQLGSICIALGYPSLMMPADLPQYDAEPLLRIGHVVRTEAAPRWLCTSSRIESGENGGGLFDLEGRLIGISVGRHWLESGPADALHAGIELVEKHWDELAAAERRQMPQAADRKPPLEPDQDLVTATVKRAREAAVGIAWGDQERDGCSGTIVTADGYVVTCEHHHRPTGEAVRIHLADGRILAGKVLGSDPLLDIGLMRITDKGTWPFAPFGTSMAVQPDDPCIALGYPKSRPDGSTQPRWQEPLVRLGHVIGTTATPGRIDTSCVIHGGDSGGGLFDIEGRIIGTHIGPLGDTAGSWHAGAELFQNHWDFLGSDMPHPRLPLAGLGETGEIFRRGIQQNLPITVEVLSDGKRCALGTIVGREGWILTKASELYGDISCRLADNRILPAVVRKVSQEHDLAVVTIDADNLLEATWSKPADAPLGMLIAALGCGASPSVGVVAKTLHAVPREPGWLLIGSVKAGNSGPEVHDDSAARARGNPMRKGDIIVHVEGSATPDLESYLKLTESPGVGVASVIAGDPIRVGIKRGNEHLEFRFPLIPESTSDGRSLRRSAFAAVFDIDVPVAPDLCGGPVVDGNGHVIGIAIACKTDGGRVYAIPADIAQQVLNESKRTTAD